MNDVKLPQREFIRKNVYIVYVIEDKEIYGNGALEMVIIY